jgi:hypothetical protein
VLAQRDTWIRFGALQPQASDLVHAFRQTIHIVGASRVGPAAQGMQRDDRATRDQSSQPLPGVDPDMGNADLVCAAERVAQAGVEVVLTRSGGEAITFFKKMGRDLFRSDERDNIHRIACFIRKNQLNPSCFVFHRRS